MNHFQATRQDILKFILVCAIAYALCLSFRLIELPLWQAEHLWIDGEPLMATHDAYAWMAGAKGTGRKFGSPMSDMLAFLHALTGLKLGVINFWLPALLAPLVVIPTTFICWILNRDIASGLVAGVLAGGATGFLLRTRLGFGDTDILTLFLPMAFGAGLVWYFNPKMRSTWLKPKHAQPVQNDSIPSPGTLLKLPSNIVQAGLVGLILAAYTWFYPNGYPIVMYTLIMATAAAIFLWPGQHRSDLWEGLGIILALGLLKWLGVGLIIIYVVVRLKQNRLSVAHTALFFFFLFLCCIPFVKGLSSISSLFEPVLRWTKLFGSQTTETALKLPNVIQSVREAQNINWDQVSQRIGINWFIFVPAFLGYLFAIWKRPLMIIFLPMLGLSIMAFKMGNRFSMYGGPILGLGLSIGISFLLNSLTQKRFFCWGIFALLAIAISIPVWTIAKNFRPAPILPKVYAQTFKDLQEKASENAQLWQWWDYGYAAQYYAERRSFGDGGHQRGPYLYALGLVHSTTSPLQASRFMKFVASTQEEQRRLAEQNGTAPPRSEAQIEYYSIDPLQRLNEMGPEKAQRFVEGLADKEKNFAQEDFGQFLVLSWENLRLAYWITYYGNWDLATGKGLHGRIQKVRGKVSIQKNGIIAIQNRKIPLKSLDVITKQGTRHTSWGQSSDIHVILNKLSNEIYIMDSFVYNSMMVQMLIGDPEEYDENFELVLDRYPWNRVYLVK